MKRVELERVKSSTGSSFMYGTTECRYFPKPLHYHPEIELVYINKGEGVCFAGDGMISFRAGDLFFFMAGMTHYFRSAPQFYELSYPLRCGSTYIQFSESILPADYQRMPGCRGIKSLIDSSSMGLKWCRESCPEHIIQRIENMGQVSGFARLMILYDLLDCLSGELGSAESISSVNGVYVSGDGAYKSVLDYIMLNFNQNITLDELAEYAGMNRTALCRHFRNRVDRSIFDFLLEFRVKYAQQQLLTTKLHISQIAIEAGFNNLPNFNVQFKRLTGCTPGEYRNR
ncbi:MAG: AraC family transcriptional regulator [Rikenellaceae bacterium]